MFLFKGWTPAFIRLGPNTVLLFVFFEVGISFHLAFIHTDYISMAATQERMDFSYEVVDPLTFEYCWYTGITTSNVYCLNGTSNHILDYCIHCTHLELYYHDHDAYRTTI
jgi:hypothetical protein